MIVTLALYETPEADTVDSQEKLLVGGAFIGSCVLGISLAIWPGWFRRSGGGGHGTRGDKTGGRGRLGHHPDCDLFQAHVIWTKGKSLCAGCTGLALGSVASILLTIVYLVLPLDIQPTILHGLMVLGIVLVVVTYIEIVAPARNVLVHVTTNILLVVGFFSLVIGSFQLTGSLAYGLLGVVISFLLLDTRIQLSSWRHNRICANCRESCKVY
jgi:hypothetical protein